MRWNQQEQATGKPSEAFGVRKAKTYLHICTPGLQLGVRHHQQHRQQHGGREAAAAAAGENFSCYLLPAVRERLPFPSYLDFRKHGRHTSASRWDVFHYYFALTPASKITIYDAAKNRGPCRHQTCQETALSLP